MEKTQTRDNIKNQVIDIIFGALNLKTMKKENVTEATPLTKGGLELDSVDILEIVVNFESAFNIKLDESEAFAQHFTNIGTIIDFIIDKQKQG